MKLSLSFIVKRICLTAESLESRRANAVLSFRGEILNMHGEIYQVRRTPAFLERLRSAGRGKDELNSRTFDGSHLALDSRFYTPLAALGVEI